MTGLSWYVLALLEWLVSAHLVRNCHTLLPWYRYTLLFRNIITHRVGNLLLLGLGHVNTSLVWVPLAGTGYGSPDLIMAMALPLVLTVFLVLCHTLCLSVRLILSLALLPGGWLAQSLCLCPAHLLILCSAHLCLCLLVFSVPQSSILCPTLYRPCQGGCLHWVGGDNSCILWGS